MKVPTRYFGGLDIIFYGDVYQAEPIHDCSIFQALADENNIVPYNFWQENVKCYNLQTIVKQKDQKFISILNRICIGF